MLTSTVHDLFHFLSSLDYGVDIVEIYGGEARASALAMRRRLNAGPNYDLITDVDLNDPEHQAAGVHDVRHHRPLVAVMATTCKPIGRWVSVEYKMNLES